MGKKKGSVSFLLTPELVMEAIRTGKMDGSLTEIMGACVERGGEKFKGELQDVGEALERIFNNGGKP